MKNLLIVISCLSTFAGMAQLQLERQVVATTGSSGGNNNLQVSYTVGEPLVTTLASPDFILTQGFQQPTAKLVGIETPEGINWEVHHFPNPTRSQLTVDILGDVNGTILLQVVDVQGRLIHQEEITKGLASYRYLLSVDQWAAGMYILSLQAEDSKAVNLPFQKVN